MAEDSIYEKPKFVRNTRVTTDFGKIGIFARAEQEDAVAWVVESDLQEFDKVFSEFSEEQGLRYRASSLYYHDRFEGNLTVLRMSHTILESKDEDVPDGSYFYVNIMEYPDKRKQYIVELNNRFDNVSNNLSVWEYKDDEFHQLEDVQARLPNSEIELGKNAMLTVPGTEKCNPFIEVLFALDPSLAEKASG